MIFNSLTFLAFFAILLSFYQLPLSWRAKKFGLLLASYVFYAAWNPPFVMLLWISTVVDWFAAGRMGKTANQTARRALLVLSLVSNFGLLGFFKYGDFLLANFTTLLAALGVQYSPPRMDIILPVGISFYTFQTLSYTIDVYRRQLLPSNSLLDFSLFVTFFPQLVAGPIVRASDFLPQLKEPRRATSEQMGWGLTLITIGLFGKVVLADALLAPVADAVYAAAAQTTLLEAWVGTLAFSGQIFFDFAGYSTCAVGVALCFGFVLRRNFHYPYAAIGFSDFWQRWHVSLSTWLRDYLYIPLGGNRKGRRRTQVNLMLTMLLGGLWHGADWRFVAWGGLHGAYLVGERIIRNRWQGRTWENRWYVSLSLALLTHFLVLITWVFFRAADFRSAYLMLSAMFAGRSGLEMLSPLRVYSVLALTAGTLATHWLLRDTSLESVWATTPVWTRSAALAGLLISVMMAPGTERAFIYFQF